MSDRQILIELRDRHAAELAELDRLLTQLEIVRGRIESTLGHLDDVLNRGGDGESWKSVRSQALSRGSSVGAGKEV